MAHFEVEPEQKVPACAIKSHTKDKTWKKSNYLSVFGVRGVFLLRFALLGHELPLGVVPLVRRREFFFFLLVHRVGLGGEEVEDAGALEGGLLAEDVFFFFGEAALALGFRGLDGFAEGGFALELDLCRGLFFDLQEPLALVLRGAVRGLAALVALLFVGELALDGGHDAVALFGVGEVLDEDRRRLAFHRRLQSFEHGRQGRRPRRVTVGRDARRPLRLGGPLGADRVQRPLPLRVRLDDLKFLYNRRLFRVEGRDDGRLGVGPELGFLQVDGRQLGHLLFARLLRGDLGQTLVRLPLELVGLLRDRLEDRSFQLQLLPFDEGGGALFGGLGLGHAASLFGVVLLLGEAALALRLGGGDGLLEGGASLQLDLGVGLAVHLEKAVPFLFRQGVGFLFRVLAALLVGEVLVAEFVDSIAAFFLGEILREDSRRPAFHLRLERLEHGRQGRRSRGGAELGDAVPLFRLGGPLGADRVQRPLPLRVRLRETQLPEYLRALRFDSLQNSDLGLGPELLLLQVDGRQLGHLLLARLLGQNLRDAAIRLPLHFVRFVFQDVEDLSPELREALRSSSSFARRRRLLRHAPLPFGLLREGDGLLESLGVVVVVVLLVPIPEFHEAPPFVLAGGVDGGAVGFPEPFLLESALDRQSDPVGLLGVGELLDEDRRRVLFEGIRHLREVAREGRRPGGLAVLGDEALPLGLRGLFDADGV
mmetsp:Transcript_12285/g.40162  ORF Transcript_12285/g.40162 Transcript_12285/m.40162 type:complete len:708 (-) Transcript_12285:1113-3236(-)